MTRLRQSGFTLAELLIALAILGVIATFTIPKVLNSTQSSQNTAIAKEAASMVSGAFSALQLQTGIVSGTTAGALTQFMNYVAVDTSAATYSFAQACSASTCLKLHNGGVLQYNAANTFGGTASTHGILFNLDPDGTGSIGPATFVQFYNGRITTAGAETGEATGGTAPTSAGTDPTYIQNWN